MIYGPEAFEQAHAWETTLLSRLLMFEQTDMSAPTEVEGIERLLELSLEHQAVLGDLHDSLMNRIEMARHNEIMEIP